MIVIDGAYGSGGGQMIRTALALSVFTGKPFRADNIRAGRKIPGLKHQHIHCIKAAQQFSDAYVEGVEPGSSSIKFMPKRFKPKNLEIDMRTAGSITLFFQSVLLPAMFAPKPIKISVIGGTDVQWSMSADYFINVFLPHIKSYADISCTILRRGYYPKGDGHIILHIKPKAHFICPFDKFKTVLSKFQSMTFAKRGSPISVRGISHASSSLEQSQVAERQRSSAQINLKKTSLPVDIDCVYAKTSSSGSGITLWSVIDSGEETPQIMGVDALGSREKRAEDVGIEASEKLMAELKNNAAVDIHLQDSLIPFLALFGGSMHISKLTNHTLTNIYVVEKFLNVKFRVDDDKKIISVSP